jgi:hypothetical protein
MQTWTFGPAGIYTATWDGISKVTVTLTAGGAFVASFAAQSLTQAIASPEYQAILSPAPQAGPGFSLLATTGAAGFTLQNATPTILSWTAPNDGQLHRVTCFGMLHVTSAETGGQISIQYFGPFGGASAHTSQILAAGLGTDTAGQAPSFFNVSVGGGTTVSILQSTALTAGAAVLWAEIWGS